MKNDEVANDDARQARSLAEVKETVGDRVNLEIEKEAAPASATERGKIAAVGARMRDEAVNEAVANDRGINQARKVARGSQFIDYGFGLLYGLLAIRLVLALIAARSSNGFVQLIRTVTDPFYAPFKGIVPSPTTEAGYTVVVPIIIAIVVYALLHAGINGFLRMMSSRKTAI